MINQSKCNNMFKFMKKKCINDYYILLKYYTYNTIGYIRVILSYYSINIFFKLS